MYLWILGLSAAYAVALSGVTVMPIVVLSLSNVSGYDEGLATIIASSELAGIAIYGLLSPRASRERSALTALLGIAAVIIGNIASQYTETSAFLAAVRFITGLGEGAIFSLVCMSFASRANAERLWGAVNLFGGLGMGLLLVSASVTPERVAGVPIFLILAGFAAAMMLFFPLIFKRVIAGATVAEHSRIPKGKITATMTAIFLIYMVQAAEWAVCGLVGEAAGLKSTDVGIYLAICSIAGFLGAIVPLSTSDKAKRLPFVMLGLLVIAVSVYVVLHHVNAVVFVAGQTLINVGFYIATPFLTGVLTENDPDGSLMARTLVIAILGATVGTATAGPVLAAAGTAYFTWYCLAPLLLVGICTSIVFVHLHRALPPKGLLEEKT